MYLSLVAAAWWPCILTYHNALEEFGKGLPKDNFCEINLKSDQEFWRTSKFTELISPANSGLFVMNGLFVNLDLNVECAIDLQISSHKNKGCEQI